MTYDNSDLTGNRPSGRQIAGANMKRYIVFGIVLIVTLVLVAGCGDEDCPTCPPFAQQLIVSGVASVANFGLGLGAYVWDVDGDVPAVDSVKIGGHLCELRTTFQGIPMVSARFEGVAGPLGSGDNVSITVYTPSGSGTATVKLLDGELDKPVGFNYPVDAPYGTVAVGDSIVVSWSAVANADWYSVSRSYRYDSSGTAAYWSTREWQTDTSLTIPASMMDYNGYYRFTIGPTTGPRPDQAGNMSGDVINGTINSNTGESLDVQVGSGYPFGGSPPPWIESEPDLLMLPMSGP